MQVSLIEAGIFSTKGLQNMVRAEEHPAYAKAALEPNNLKNFLTGESWPPGTPPVSAAVKVIYELAQVEDPPRHLPLGKDAVQAAKKRAAALLENAEEVASCSEGLGA